MEQGEPTAAWRVARPSVFKVISGEIWLTVEGDSEDYWLAMGQSIDLPSGAVAWVSAGQAGARFALASGSERAAVQPSLGLSVLRRLPRWLGVA
ncbi:MAG: FIG00453813: hypothetical protein [uncultured Paraburkholderia sp.]|nr:MAG: FIG00453813: hypothetical protein [uncultured Paraburkholderia sp.]CAH2922352.1 MAG: FIG00453813: hypothetical protein [uncultured Paraburkholderia sp.]